MEGKDWDRRPFSSFPATYLPLTFCRLQALLGWKHIVGPRPLSYLWARHWRHLLDSLCWMSPSAVWPYLRNYLFTRSPRHFRRCHFGHLEKPLGACNRGKYFQLAA